MQKLIIALIIIAILVGGYRFVSSRREEAQEAPIEITETEPTATPTPEQTTGFSEAGEPTGQGLPSAGGSTEQKPTLPPEELEKMIEEFESKKQR